MWPDECEDRVWVTSPGVDCWKCNLPKGHEGDHKSVMEGENIDGKIERVEVTVTWKH